MAVPDYQTVMLPLLQFLNDGKEHSRRDAIEHISKTFNLTEAERIEPLPSGQQPIIDNRVGWARTYMKKAKLLETPKRGYLKITERGLNELRKKPDKININFLNRFPEFVEFRTVKRETTNGAQSTFTEQTELDQEDTPDELLERGYASILASLSEELLDKVRRNPPDFFENIVLNLLQNMGYGKGKVTGGSGDGGIDGFINQDRLGLDKVFFQAKRFSENHAVPVREIRDFVGSLDLHRVNKGVFITTSTFPRNAENLVSGSQKSIILIDGKKLVRLMIEHDIGVASEKIYNIKRIDSDFFPED